MQAGRSVAVDFIAQRLNTKTSLSGLQGYLRRSLFFLQQLVRLLQFRQTVHDFRNHFCDQDNAENQYPVAHTKVCIVDGIDDFDYSHRQQYQSAQKVKIRALRDGSQHVIIL